MLLRSTPRSLSSTAACATRFLNTNRTVTLIPGDGIGTEITGSVKAIFSAAKVPITWDEHDEVHGSTKKNITEDMLIPESVHNSILQNKVVLKGPFFSPFGYGHTSIDKILSKKYDLFAHVVPCYVPSISATLPFKDLNLVIIRENTEAEYSGLEHEVVEGVVESLKVVTRTSCERIAKYAFDYAVSHNHPKVIAVHKANIMKMTDGLFLEVCRQTAKKYPQIKLEELIVDNCAMQLVNYPKKFTNTVVVTTNLYGTIVSNIAAGLVGGPGVIGGYNVGPEITVYEQGTRHVALDIAGKNIANPLGLIRASLRMLRKLELDNFADQIRNAVRTTLADGKALTKDLGGKCTTTEFTQAIITNLK